MVSAHDIIAWLGGRTSGSESHVLGSRLRGTGTGEVKNLERYGHDLAFNIFGDTRCYMLSQHIKPP